MKRWIGIGMMVLLLSVLLGVTGMYLVITVAWWAPAFAVGLAVAGGAWVHVAGRLIESKPRKLTDVEQLLKLTKRYPAPQEWYDE